MRNRNKKIELILMSGYFTKYILSNKGGMSRLNDLQVNVTLSRDPYGRYLEMNLLFNNWSRQKYK